MTRKRGQCVVDSVRLDGSCGFWWFDGAWSVVQNVPKHLIVLESIPSNPLTQVLGEEAWVLTAYMYII